MMEYTLCPNCGSNYDENTNFPKILPCGHSFCAGCVRSLLSSLDTSCPECKIKFSPDENIPRNFSLIETIKNLFDQRYFTDVSFQIEVQPLKETFKEKLKYLKGTKGSFEFVLRLKTSELKKEIQKFKSKPNYINYYATDLISIHNQTPVETDRDMKYLSKIEYYVSLRLSDTGIKHFVPEIYHKKLVRGEKVYMIGGPHGYLKFGEVTKEDDMIFFHSLELHYNAIEEKNPTVISLEDVKTWVKGSNKKLHTFLKVSSKESNIAYTIIIEMFESIQSLMFIKMCTKELCTKCKTSFSDMNEKKEVKVYRIWRFLSFTSNCTCVDEMDYFSNENFATFNSEDIILQGGKEGSFTFTFGVVNGENIRCPVIGKVIYPPDMCDVLSAYKTLRIKNSGLACYIFNS